MKKGFLLIFIMSFILISSNLWSLDSKKHKNDIQRHAERIWDNQRNTLSNFDFMSSNYGIIGLDVVQNMGSGIWPRGSQNQYSYGCGFWFAAKKLSPDSTKMQKYVELSYNPNNGRSWFSPGRIEDGYNMDSTKKDKYRVYISTDFDKATGVPLNTSDGPNWSLWIDDNTMKYQYGTYRHSYIYDENKRNTNDYPLGPMFVSDEDIVSTFKDTDLNYFDNGADYRKSQGYPLRLQAESRIYTWNKEDMKDVILISYLILNKSKDTLMNCWFGGLFDFDIAYLPNALAGASNDRTKYFDDERDLNLAVAWSDTNQGEAGRGFGYVGVSFIESPAIDVNGFIRNDKYIFPLNEQIGLKTFRNWSIDNDVQEDNARYDYISGNVLDGDNGSGDKRMLLGTGPFNMLPGDTARVVISVAFALPAKGGEADGTYEDITGFKKLADKKNGSSPQTSNNSLVGKIKTAYQNYYEYVPLSVNDNTIESGLTLNSVYPNPVSNLASIKYHLSNAGNIRLALYNQLGQEVALIREGYEEAGDYNRTFSFEKNKIIDGLYFLRLQSGSQTQTKEIVVVH